MTSRPGAMTSGKVLPRAARSWSAVGLAALLKVFTTTTAFHCSRPSCCTPHEHHRSSRSERSNRAHFGLEHQRLAYVGGLQSIEHWWRAPARTAARQLTSHVGPSLGGQRRHQRLARRRPPPRRALIIPTTTSKATPCLQRQASDQPRNRRASARDRVIRQRARPV